MKHTIQKYLLFFLFPCILFAQKGLITGHVIDAMTRQPLIGANVVIEGQGYGAATDEFGIFRINVPYGIYTIKFSYIGYDSERRIIQLSERSDPLSIDVSLNSEAIFESEVKVEGKLNIPSTEIQNLKSKEIEFMPNLFNDPMRSVQVLSGVVTNNELSSGYNVRGGSFDENLIYINGFEIYRPFLLRQGIEENQTLISPDLITEINFMNGAFPVNYGDKMSSALFTVYGLPEIDTTIIKLRADLLNLGGSLIHTVRKFKVDASVRYAYPSLFTDALQTRGDYHPSYSDFQINASYTFSKSAVFNILGIYSRNDFTLKPQSWTGHFGGFSRGDYRELKIDYDGTNSYNFNTILIAGRLKFNLSDDLCSAFSFSNYSTGEQEDRDLTGKIYYNGNAESDDDSSFRKWRHEFAENEINLNSLRIKGEFEHINSRYRLSAGLEYRFEHFQNEINEKLLETGEETLLQIPINRLEKFSINLNNFSSYANIRYILGNNIIVNAGLRFTNYNYSNEHFFSPRINISYIQSPVNTFSIKYGHYYQPPYINELRNPGLDNLKSQRSIQYVLGWERILKPNLKFSIEAYYKDLRNLIPFYHEDLKMIYVEGNVREGYAYGADLQLDGEIVRGIRSIFSYGYLDTWERDKGTKKYQRRLTDQTHTLNLFLQDKFKKSANWQSHVRFLLGSGLLYYQRETVEDENTGNKLIAVNIYKPAEYFLFFRVDMGLSAEFELTDGIELLGVAEVLNVFNHLNYSGYDWIQVFKEYNTPIKIPRVLSERFFNLRLTLKI
ncbi:MAG: TonB-dependent receptor [Melioribacteraceae bacterium]|nr:TonB-dependent receptor [Melioribacteraceae bacterium]